MGAALVNTDLTEMPQKHPKTKRKKIEEEENYETIYWVLHKVIKIRQYVGLECGGFEEQFTVLLTTIEVSHAQCKKSN